MNFIVIVPSVSVVNSQCDALFSLASADVNIATSVHLI